ncbi:UNVERIFIED_CONTAM: hypothetical protein Sangu_2773400, partial [Sesamum angustifolium]
AKVRPDEYDEKTYCAYATDASTVYGLTAFGLLLIAQALINGVTKCLCFGRGMMAAGLPLVLFCSSFSHDTHLRPSSVKKKIIVQKHNFTAMRSGWKLLEVEMLMKMLTL